MDCCCGGGYGLTNTNFKVEREGRQLPSLCRDTHSQHPVRTRACKALALFPSFMPLYSGYCSSLSLSLSLSTLSLSLYVLICETKTRIHGEVVLSAQPRWLSHGTAPDSNLSHVGLSHYAPSILCFSFHLT